MNYLIIANIYLLLFYGFYRIFLSRETFFQLNRIYLVGTTVLSFILPFIQLEWLQMAFRSSTVFVARSSLDAVTVDMEASGLPLATASAIAIPLWLYMYMGGVLIQLVLLMRKMLQLRKRLRTDKAGDAYSFMRTIKVDVMQEEGSKVMEHELVHAKQLHTLDVLYVELVKVFNWFNPVVYYLADSLKLTHEYIADEAVSRSDADRIAYAELLLSRTFSVSSSVLTNNFLNQSFIKNRIVMLLKNKSKRPALLKYILAVPLFAAMLIFSSAKVSDNERISIDAKEALEEETVSLPVLWTTEQDSTKKNTTDFNELDVQPSFPGGMQAFYKWIGENFRYSAEAKEKGVNGALLLSFIIEKDGTLNDIEVLKDLGYGTGQAAIDLLKGSPKWSPGQKNGESVRVSYNLPIQMNLSKAKQKSEN